MTPSDGHDDSGVAGLILAGGASRRLDRKPHRLLAGRPLIEHVVARAAPQVSPQWLSVNGEDLSLARLGLELVLDADADSLGPVAGIAAGLHHASQRRVALLATFPCDGPFFPPNLVQRLREALGDSAAAAVPSYRGRIHPTFGLWVTAAALPVFANALASRHLRLREAVARSGAAIVPFDEAERDPFANLNTEADFAAAEGEAAISPER